ncbi:Nucleotide-binding alpha-beta plait, partial [Penicillium macrosclerotiorum]|uniref:Nucleotide-binding alpha-beta plait n=1 Tax=Penicillium macrosclerotiorum TaxID=303699 RepID=UPI0025475AB2
YCHCQSTFPFSAWNPSLEHGLPPQSRYGPSSPMNNMGIMAYSLPNHPSHPQSYENQNMVHQYPPAHGQGLVYPIQSISHYPGQSAGGGVPYEISYASNYPPYSIQHPGASQQVGSYYQPFMAPQSMQIMGHGQTPLYGAGYYHHPHPHPSYTASYGHGVPPSTSQVRQAGSQTRQGPNGPPAVNLGAATKKEIDNRVLEAEYDVSKTIVDGSNPMKLPPHSLQASDPAAAPLLSTSNIPNAPRGPPRKPKQSGHALWVGNLPPGANVMDLKDHFSQDATNDIESVFLISKSNCAFVNYKSAAACAAALTRFHDSRFQGVRLVCRLRKGFTAPSTGTGMVASGMGVRSRPGEMIDPPSDEAAVKPEATAVVDQINDARTLDRYFIVKSLTVEDLKLSKQSGIWATQMHNETNLNHAFETTDHVYLIFSANKSGEYFGYARMLSPINDDEELALEMPPRPEPLVGSGEELEVIPTAATPTAPKGRIIDDSARGTIFWEVESEEGEDDDNDAHSEKSDPDGAIEETDLEGQSFGKPFRIEWLSTERVPFHRTRGLRNPWNANREVKIARDGTEIEPAIGRKLIALFHLS